MLKTLQSGKTPLTIESHEVVATQYQVPTINVAKELADEITAGTNTWQQYGGVHPGPLGNALCARMMEELFNRAWAAPLAANSRVTTQTLPPKPIDVRSYFVGRFVDPKLAQIKNGWTLEIPDWKNLQGGKRNRFVSIPMLCSTKPGAEASLDFEGTAIGAYVVSGPDAGIVEARVDGGPVRSVNLFRDFSGELHYPWTVMFETDLKPGKHKLTLRMACESKTTGHAMRIMQFTVN